MIFQKFIAINRVVFSKFRSLWSLSIIVDILKNVTRSIILYDKSARSKNRK